MKNILLTIALPLAMTLAAADYHVDCLSGDDANDGRSASAPFRTFARAAKSLGPGDTLHLTPGRIYHETLKLVRGGTAAKPVVIDGHGAVISGLMPIPDGSWQDRGDGLFLSPNARRFGACMPNVCDAAGNFLSLDPASRRLREDPSKLAPGEAAWNREGAWFRTDGKPPKGLFGTLLQEGVALDGSIDYVTIENLVCEYVSNDGFNVHGSCLGLVFRNIEGRFNGDEGISVHEDVQMNVYHGNFHHNQDGICDICASQTLYFDCVSVSNRLYGVGFHGGYRVMYDCVIKDNGGEQFYLVGGQIAKSYGFDPKSPVLKGGTYLKNVRIGGGDGTAVRLGGRAELHCDQCAFDGTDRGFVFADGSVCHITRSRIGSFRDGPGDLDKAAVAPALIFHMDFNTAMMNRATISEVLHKVSKLGYTHILWEIEDKVRLDSCPEIAHREAMSKADFKAVLAEAEALGLEPIPLLQTFAHAEYVLKKAHPELREHSDFYDCYCVSKPETRRFLKAVVHEYLDLFGPKVKWFHLGGDEVTRFATCAKCSVRAPLELYAEHLDAVSEELRARGVRPGIWCDMVLGNKYYRDFASFPNRYMIWHWDYRVGEGRWLPGWTDRLPLAADRGFDVVFAGASQCGGEGPFLPDFLCHRLNLAYAANCVRERHLKGLCVTSWSVRHSPKRFQYPLLNFAARRLRSPGAGAEADWESALAEEGVKIPGGTLEALAAWHPDLCYYDGRAWRSLYKDGTPPPDGALAAILKRRGLPNAADITNAIVQVEAALPAVSGDWREAGELQLLLLRFMGAVSRGETPPVLPIERARKFFEREQTPWGATNAAEIVYGLGRPGVSEE